MKHPEDATKADIRSMAPRLSDDQKNDPEPHEPDQKAEEITQQANTRHHPPAVCKLFREKSPERNKFADEAQVPQRIQRLRRRGYLCFGEYHQWGLHKARGGDGVKLSTVQREKILDLKDKKDSGIVYFFNHN